MYFAVLQICLLLTFFTHLVTRTSTPKASDLSPPFSAFQFNYLLVYLLAVSADWLQGPYIYALYSHYGFDKPAIAQLYIAGFASSAILGTAVAALADKFGRRSNALLYALLYILSCLTKHSPSFRLLLLGRVLAGVAYSILCSAFEAWMVYEHSARSFDPSLLSATFARAQFWNGVVAILAGQTAGWFAARFGKVMPFDVASAVLCVMAGVIVGTWRENYGDRDASVRKGFARAWGALVADERILLVGVAQGAFEGALYIFTFAWTPALQTALGQQGELPHGTVFSAFMAATMLGSNLFAVAMRFVRIEGLMRNVFVVGAIAFGLATVWRRVEVMLSCFLVFEVLCGVYFPGMATMRAPYIPEASRSGLLTFFRVPVNVIVVVALYEDLSVEKIFAVCAGLMVVAVLSQQRLMWLTRHSEREGVGEQQDELLKMEVGLKT